MLLRLIFLSLILLAPHGDALAHTPFKLISSAKKSLNMSEVVQRQQEQTIGKIEGSTVTYNTAEIRLVVLTGLEGDPLSFQIQGLRNPNLVVPSDATLRILLINSDEDMPHDIRFGHVPGEFSETPDISTTAGSSKVAASEDNGSVHAEELVIKCGEDGAFKYFCSVRGHAKEGMWGNILVGVRPGTELKMAPKVEHVHSEGEEHDDEHDHGAAPSKDSVASVHDGHMATSHEHAPAMSVQHGASHTDDHSTQHDRSQLGHSGHDGDMRSSINIGEPMSREGSGSSWVPDASPMHAWMKMFEDGSQLMLHGMMFPRYTAIGSKRDVSIAGKGARSRFDAPSMFMAMYATPLSTNSQLGLRGMFSLDPIIEQGHGYPLLYQSGEQFEGEPLHDRQHPHDLISELAATLSFKLGGQSSICFYAGLPGEPALGPSMYLHRPSGMNMPDAPIGHHWQDATHITFGVVTLGYTYGDVKLEASTFNGTEPDDDRWGFDQPKLNSFSGRLSFNPTPEWSLQVSHGYIKEPERSEPELDVLRRTTASAIYNITLGDDADLAGTFVWGQNSAKGIASNAFLLESNYEFGANAIFGRAELVQKERARVSAA